MNFWRPGGPGGVYKAFWKWYASFPPNMSPWRATNPQIVPILTISEHNVSDRFLDFQHFLKKSIPYASPGQTHMWKTFLYWSSSYELFTKVSRFDWVLRCFVTLPLKNDFSILSLLEQVFKGFYVFVLRTPNAQISFILRKYRTSQIHPVPNFVF